MHNKMKTKFLFLGLILLSVIISSCTNECGKDDERISKIIAENNKTVKEFDTYIEECKSREPDYVVNCTHSDITNTVRGYMECPLQFCMYDSAEVHIEGLRYYADNTPVELMQLSDDTIIIKMGKDEYLMQDVEQQGSVLSFNIIACGIEKCSFSIESPFFEGKDILSNLNTNAKLPILPLLGAAAKYVIVPLVVGVASSLIANSCASDNQSAAEKCKASHERMSLDCQSRGGRPISKHSNCPSDCYYTCIPKQQ